MKLRFPPDGATLTPEDNPGHEWVRYFSYIWKKYGIPESAWRQAWKTQRGRCAICRKNRLLITDHDHATGRFRGLLCFFCNGLLGKFEKYKIRIMKYLKN